MKSDNAPSIISLCYGEEDKIKEFIAGLRNLGAGVRIVMPVDIAIPLEHKDKILNYIKHFSWFDYQKGRNPIELLKKIPSLIRPASVLGYQFYDLQKMKGWQCDSQNRLTGLQFFPIAWQDVTKYCTTAEEFIAMTELETFETRDYAPKLNFKEGKMLSPKDYGKDKI